MFHPDEPHIAEAVAKIDFPKQCDPGFYTYNSFPIYMIKLMGEFLSSMEKTTFILISSIDLLDDLFPPARQFDSWTKDVSKINLIGRWISASLATASIYLIYLLGANLINQWGGLVAAALFSFSPGLIQYAHFNLTESWLIFFVLLLTIFAIKTLKNRTFFHWNLMAIVSGLALGTKTPALSFLIIPLMVLFILIFEERKIKYLVWGISFLVVSFLVFFLTSPFTFLKFSKFIEAMKYEYGIVSGQFKVFYTWQFNRTPPYLYFFNNLHWQIGPFLPTLGFLGLFTWFF